MECIMVFKLHSYKYYRQLRHIWYTYDSHIKDNTYMYDNHMWLNCLCMTNLDRNQFINWKIIQILFEHWSPDSFFQMKHLRSLVIQKQLTHYLNSYIASFKECTFQFPWVKMIFYHQRVDKKKCQTSFLQVSFPPRSHTLKVTPSSGVISSMFEAIVGTVWTRFFILSLYRIVVFPSI